MSATNDTIPTHLIVGAGRMGGALLSGWTRGSEPLLPPENLIILDPRPCQAANEAIKAGALQLSDISADIGSVDFVVLAIKPQMFDTIANQLAPMLKPGALILSVLAGTDMASLRQVFSKQTIIRAMPNTPAAIGKGITAFTCDISVSAEQKTMARALLSAAGPVFEVDNEHQIDIVTAVSGSGPAYFFLMVEALEAAAVRVGLPAQIAPEFARQTLIGAGALLESSENSATDLRVGVTSPNGTTQAALDVLMERNGLPPLMLSAVKAALARAKELAKS